MALDSPYTLVDRVRMTAYTRSHVEMMQIQHHETLIIRRADNTAVVQLGIPEPFITRRPNYRRAGGHVSDES